MGETDAIRGYTWGLLKRHKADVRLLRSLVATT